jgi:hypothetical protein
MACRIGSLSTIVGKNYANLSSCLARLQIAPVPIQHLHCSRRDFSSPAAGTAFSFSRSSPSPSSVVSKVPGRSADPFNATSSLWSSGGLLLQSVRTRYTVTEGTIKWRRRRRKEMESRLNVQEPLSPVIEQRVPLPPNNWDKVPPGLFDGGEVRDSAKEETERKGCSK